LVSREDLVKLADHLGDKPLFLFPTFEKMHQGQAKPRFSRAKLDDW